MSSNGDQMANGSGDEVDGRPQQRKPEGPTDPPAGRGGRREVDGPAPVWDDNPNHPGNLSVAGIAAEASRIVFIPKRSPHDVNLPDHIRDDRNDRNTRNQRNR
uniref:Uncharacterized protein n=1 Tax=Tetranychus urticae TaxID=32264 RepID=T1KJZ0_TETUR